VVGNVGGKIKQERGGGWKERATLHKVVKDVRRKKEERRKSPAEGTTRPGCNKRY